jgi:hypothetical protein
MVLKYHRCLHRYIQTKIEFLDITSLGTAYRYIFKIEQKFKQKRREFGSEKASQPKQGKGFPNPYSKGQRKYGHSQDNQSKQQHKNDNEKMKMNTGKWCEYNKISWNNTKNVAQSSHSWSS